MSAASLGGSCGLFTTGKRGEGGGEQEREGGEEREGRKENFSLLRSYRGSVCVCACWSGDHAGKTH